MTTEHAKKLLLEKERSLLEERDRFQAVISESGDVGDPVDAATSDEERGEASEEASQVTETLEDVRSALQRIEAGTYGRCVVCGRPIEPKRLEAVPWTPYCLEDQERIDREKGADNDGVTL
ncbi:MAG TPA: TraR/DksA family transcriptional regulator [Bryobacteraceae bacterium]|jgi:DnaK suppressor protein|nr:TraR/DksA family transcriptional regulator [Bryobacteraceae bacterium]